MRISDINFSGNTRKLFLELVTRKRIAVGKTRKFSALSIDPYQVVK